MYFKRFDLFACAWNLVLLTRLQVEGGQETHSQGSVCVAGFPARARFALIGWHDQDLLRNYSAVGCVSPGGRWLILRVQWLNDSCLMVAKIEP